MTQQRDPGGCSFSSLLRATSFRLSSCVSSPLCPHSAGAQSKWLQMKFCVGLLRGSLSLQASFPGRQKPCCFSLLDVIWVLSQLWYCRLGSPPWGLDPTLLRGKAPAAEISLLNFSCLPWEPSQPSCTSSALPTSLILVKWFLLFVHGYKASLHLAFSWLFRMISLQFSCNFRFVLGVVSVASTYSSTILDFSTSL